MIIQVVQCDGCGARNDDGRPTADLPKGWRAFSLQGNTIVACSEMCAIKTLKQFVDRYFKDKQNLVR